MSNITKRRVTSTRMNWARQQTDQQVRATGGTYDHILLWYLFTSNDGPDHGVDGTVEPPDGDIPGGSLEDASAGGSEDGAADPEGSDPEPMAAPSSSDSSFGSGSSYDGSSGGGDSGGGGGGE